MATNTSIGALLLLLICSIAVALSVDESTSSTTESTPPVVQNKICIPSSSSDEGCDDADKESSSTVDEPSLAAAAAGKTSSASCSKVSSEKMSQHERTFIAIKPDAVQRGIVGKVISRFEERGYKLVAMKMVHASKPHLEVHYQELKDKPFFGKLVEYMASGPIVAMVWEGLDVVKQGRIMLGATNPLASNPGTIRGDYSIQTGRNIVHGSDSLPSAEREIAHWFKKEEIVEWTPANAIWVYE